MNGKIEQPVCMKSCVKHGKAATETLEMLREDFGQRSLNSIHVSRPVECQLKMQNAQSEQAPAKPQEKLKTF
jgi:hypothetical protein